MSRRSVLENQICALYKENKTFAKGMLAAADAVESDKSAYMAIIEATEKYVRSHSERRKYVYDRGPSLDTAFRTECICGAVLERASDICPVCERSDADILDELRPDAIQYGIGLLKLGTKARNALKRLGCETIWDVTQLTRDDILRARFAGPKALESVQNSLREVGLSLRRKRG